MQGTLILKVHRFNAYSLFSIDLEIFYASNIAVSREVVQLLLHSQGRVSCKPMAFFVGHAMRFYLTARHDGAWNCRTSSAVSSVLTTAMFATYSLPCCVNAIPVEAHRTWPILLLQCRVLITDFKVHKETVLAAAHDRSSLGCVFSLSLRKGEANARLFSSLGDPASVSFVLFPICICPPYLYRYYY